MATRIPLVGMLLLSGLLLAACGGGTNGPPAQANYTGNQGPQPGDSSILGDAGLRLAASGRAPRSRITPPAAARLVSTPIYGVVRWIR